jgi:hypothetical protein
MYGFIGSSGDTLYSPWFARGGAEKLRFWTQIVASFSSGTVTITPQHKNVGDASVESGTSSSALSAAGTHAVDLDNGKELVRLRYVFAGGGRVAMALVGMVAK